MRLVAMNNSKGFGHVVVPMLVFVLFAFIGTTYIIISRAATPSASQVTYSAGTALAACMQTGQTTVTGATNTTVRDTVGAPSGNMSPVIQTDINNASSAGGGIVMLGTGTYQLNSRLTMEPNVELEGSSETGSILQIETPNTGVITTDGASNTTIANMTIDQNGQNLNSRNGGGNPAYYEVTISGGTNNILQQLQVVNPVNYMIDATSTPNTFCIRNNTVLVNGSESKYSNNTYANLDGIHIDGGTNGDVTNNYVDERDNGATDGDDALVAQGYQSNESYISYVGNVARGGNNGDCMQFAVGPSNISNDTVQNNEFYGCPYGVRTGGYATTGSVSNITLTNNIVHNIVGGTGSNGSFPTGGNAVDIGGFLKSGQSATNNVVQGTYICSAGNVVSASGSTVSGTQSYPDCTDVASSATPPPTYPPGQAVTTGNFIGIDNKCIDNSGSKMVNDNKIDLWGCNHTNAQVWTVNESTGTIVNANGYCIDVAGGGTTNGTDAVLYQCNGSASQQWTYNSTAHTIVNKASGLCVDDQHSLTTSGNQIWIYKCNGTSAQQWTLESA